MLKKTQSTEASIYSRDTEQMVLGCMLSSELSFKSCFEKNQVEVSDFHYPEHQVIFGGLRNLYTLGSPSDILLLTEHLKQAGKLEEAGGIAYLVDLAQLSGTGAHFDSYFNLLKEVASRRQFVYRCDELKHQALNKKNDIASMAALAATSFNEISRQTLPQKSQSLLNISKSVDKPSFLEDLQRKRAKGLKEGKWQIPGISTGFQFLDSTIGGLRDENFIIIAARPSVGKTAFALNLLRNLSLSQKVPTAFFSLEMTSNQLFLRLLSSQSGIPAHKIETGNLSESQMEQIETALLQLENSPIYINDSCYEASKILMQMKLLAQENNVRAFFIDYVGLIRPTKEREIKAYEIGDITRGLKNFANEMHVPIVCLAQLNRQADQNMRPQLSMLKDSGNLEQDADSVLFLHRRDLHDPNDKPGQVEVIIAKNRHGSTDTRAFQFNKEIGVVSEFIEEKAATWD